jgi:hypothetical protein
MSNCLGGDGLKVLNKITIMILLFVILILSTKVYAKVVYKTNIISVYTITNYDKFYNTLSACILKKEKKVSLKFTNYNKKLYDINKVIQEVTKANPNFKYMVSLTSYEGTTLGSKATINYSFNYVEYDNSANDLTVVYNKIKAGMKSGESSISFNTNNAVKYSFEAFSKVIDKAINENPEIRYFNKWNTSYSSNGYVATYKVEFALNFTKEKILLMENKLKEKIHSIVATEINSNMKDYEKELKLHDYIVNHTIYDYQNLLNNTVPNVAYTAYGVLINGVGVCEGYSYAMKRLLDEVGIESRVITGEVFGASSGPHAWNLVKLSNEYYQLDVTFDDPVVNDGSENVLSHSYFNLTDIEMSKNHTWDITKYPKCNNATFKFNNNK